VATLEPLIDDDTIMLVGSAPCYPHGVIDPIGEIGKLAERHDLWLHVDACVGGWLAPFFRRIGRPVPDFDFAVPAVRSISADPHKFGFCPKPASTVLFRDREDMERAKFVADAWPAGVYQTATLAGTRPAGSVAGAWAVINHLGTSGYEAAARAIAAMTDAYVADLAAIEDIELWAKPDLSIVNFGSNAFDIFAAAEGMSKRGWLPALTRRPKGMHLMLSRFHEAARGDFIRDLKASIGEVRQAGTAGKMKATY
jgi:glutamate/tyrosine decarboxylase-like PLP-dependent enzyme